jgi:hypothetical protein
MNRAFTPYSRELRPIFTWGMWVYPPVSGSRGCQFQKLSARNVRSRLHDAARLGSKEVGLSGHGLVDANHAPFDVDKAACTLGGFENPYVIRRVG